MSFLFYISVFLISIMRIPTMLNWNRVSKKYSIMSKVSSNKGTKFFENDKDIKVALYVVSNYFSIALSVIGLLSSNWFLFILVLMVTLQGHKIPLKGKFKRIALGISFSISTLILIFIPINYFHLGIDVLEQIKNYLY